MRLSIRPFTDPDRLWAEPFLFPAGPPFRFVRRGVVDDPFTLPGLVAESEGRPAGLATYTLWDDGCELFSLHAIHHGQGAGTALFDAVAAAARAAECSRLWVVTTNDNTPAIRFYQRRGMRLGAVRIGACDAARLSLKPELPMHGVDGIRIRDELEFEFEL